MIDDDVFVYNDVERRIERLPFTVSGNASANDSSGDNNGADNSLPFLLEDTTSATIGRHR